MAEGHPSQAIMQLIMAPWITQTIGALARLKAFDAMKDGPTSAANVAEKIHASPDAISRALRAAAAIGVVARHGDRYALTPVGELLRSDVHGSMRALLDAETAPGHWLPWGRFDEALRTGKSQSQAALGMDAWAYYGANPEEGRAFSEGMSGLSAMSIAAIDAAYTLPASNRIVDVGGAHGAFLAYALTKQPNAKGVLFDLPAVIESSGALLEKAGVSARVERVAGSFLESVPAEGDLYLLKHIMHDWDDERAQAILTNVRRAMAPNAKVICVDMLIPDDPSPAPSIFMDLNMLVMLDGRERTGAEMTALFGRAGLRVDRIVPTPSPFVVVEASRA